jgi:DNA-directed RNA polymerase subunit RPC12/RpoP
MPIDKLKKIGIALPPEVRGRAVLMPDFTVVPVLKGSGDRHYTCAECGITLLQGLPASFHIQNVVIRCPKCKSFNDVTV